MIFWGNNCRYDLVVNDSNNFSMIEIECVWLWEESEKREIGEREWEERNKWKIE